MLVIETATAPQMLQLMLDQGLLGSQYELMIAGVIKDNDSFYNRTKAEKGELAADQELVEWNQRARLSDLAAGIQPVARGMLALAKIDSGGEHVNIGLITEQSDFPICYKLPIPSPVVVVFNREIQSCACNLAPGCEEFSPGGGLGLIALTLQAGYSVRRGAKVAQLGLVISQRTTSQKRLNESGYIVVTVNLDGMATGHSYSPVIRQQGFLKYALGLENCTQLYYLLHSSGGNFDDAVGFPGAVHYIAEALPRLAGYLVGLAANLDPAAEHSH